MKRTYGFIPWICGAAAVILGFMGLCTLLDKRAESLDIIVGTYGEKLYTYSFDTETFEFTKLSDTEARNASYALSDGNGNIYAVSETGSGSGVYSFNADKELQKTAEKRQAGADPCFVLIHRGMMMTADYSGGSVSVFPINPDGSIGDICRQLKFSGSGPVESRQESSHIHQLRVMPGNGEWILASDLGADRIRLLSIQEDGMLSHFSDIECPPGSGPRHMEFSKDGSMLYCLGEISGEVLVYEIEYGQDAPSFSLVQRIQADEVNAAGSADIHIHPEGTWLYTSHRLDNDGISIFRIREDGTIEKTGYVRTARHPRNFMITPDGKALLVACKDDKLIQSFRISDDGSLTPTPSVVMFDSDQPSSVTEL